MRQRNRKRRPVVFYHRTTLESAECVLAKVFRDGEGHYLTRHRHKGVWLSDVPLAVNEGARGDILFKVSLDMNASELDCYEWVEEGKSYREWLVPARVINPRMRLDIVDEYGLLGHHFPSRWLKPLFSESIRNLRRLTELARARHRMKRS